MNYPTISCISCLWLTQWSLPMLSTLFHQPSLSDCSYSHFISDPLSNNSVTTAIDPQHLLLYLLFSIDYSGSPLFISDCSYNYLESYLVSLIANCLGFQLTFCIHSIVYPISYKFCSSSISYRYQIIPSIYIYEIYDL